MDFKAAIAALKKLDADNIDELVSAVEGHVTRLEEKSYETIGESRKNASKARTMQATVEAIAKVLGVDGEADAVLEALEPKVKEISDGYKTIQAKLSEAETRATTAEGKIATLERQSKIQEIASIAGADAKVLQRLLADQIDQIQIDGDAVKLGEVSLKEFVEADGELKLFLPALFPSSTAESPTPAASPAPSPKLPSGGPDSKQQAADPVDDYLSRTYTGAKAFAK